MDVLQLRIDPEAAARIDGLWAVGRIVRATSTDQGDRLPDPATVVDADWTLENLREEPRAAGFRKVSWAVGIDPTKHRPSGEALARRIIGGKGVPTILPLVDAYNLASAATLVPIGAYDLDHVQGNLTVRPAGDDESFHGIGRDAEHLAPGRIVYADDAGTVCGVMLWRDAQATCIRKDTERALLLSVGADPVPRTEGEAAIVRAVELLGHVGFTPDGPVVMA